MILNLYFLKSSFCHCETWSTVGSSGKSGTMEKRPVSNFASIPLNMIRPFFGSNSSGAYVFPKIASIVCCPCLKPNIWLAVTVEANAHFVRGYPSQAKDWSRRTPQSILYESSSVHSSLALQHQKLHQGLGYSKGIVRDSSDGMQEK